jgi:hypothetical protein
MRGKGHEYLGMSLKFSEKGKVRIDMTKYVKEFLSNVPDDMDGEFITPAASHIFR